MNMRTTSERLKACLDSLPEKQKRVILILMLAVSTVSSGIVLLRTVNRSGYVSSHAPLPFREGCMADTLRQLPEQTGRGKKTFQQFLKEMEQDGKQE